MVMSMWLQGRGTALDVARPRLSCSTGASTDEDGLPLTPPDAHFLDSPVLAPTGVPSKPRARGLSGALRSSSLLEIALDNNALAPFTYHSLSRSPSPPPSPPTAITGQHCRRALPAGYEVIPWVSSDDEDDEEGTVMSRSLSPPLHDFLSVPPLSPDLDDDDHGAAVRRSPRTKDDGDLPPSPPRTPSPPRSLALPAVAQPLAWSTAPPGQATPSEHVSPPPSPTRRALARASLSPLQTQLPPARTVAVPPASSPKSRSAPPSPPRSSSRSSSGRRRSASFGSNVTPSSPRSRTALQLPALDEPRGRSATAFAEHGFGSSERGRSRAARRAGEEGTSRVRRAGEHGCVDAAGGDTALRSSEKRRREKPHNGVVAPSLSSSDGGLQLVLVPGSDSGNESDDEYDTDDADDPHTRAYFERHCHSLSLLRLRHALSIATTYAKLPPPTPMPSARGASTSTRPIRSRNAVSLPSATSSSYVASSRSAAATPAGNMVSQQYRLYALGRAKAQRTGGVGYWEGGMEAWELLLMD